MFYKNLIVKKNTFIRLIENTLIAFYANFKKIKNKEFTS